MDGVSENVALLLDGKPYEELYEFCDFSIQDQLDASFAKGVHQSTTANFKPVIKKSVTYIVAAVLVNELGETLMMQEAKSSCAGQWYLPAGRMEPGEDISEAAKREVKEETGLDFEVMSLLMVECAGGNWFRFVVTGQVTGGRLKTPAEADSESLQAKWIANLGELSLRGNDILPLVDLGKRYHLKNTSESERWHLPQLPAIRPHKKLLLRLVVAARRRSDNAVCVLASEKTVAHLPVCELHPMRSVHSTLKKFLAEIFGSDLPAHRPQGLLSVEHSGKPITSNDGVCLSLLVSLRIPLEDVCLVGKYTWLALRKLLGEKLLSRLGRNKTVALSVIR